MNRVALVLLLCLLHAAFFLDAEARKCPRGERNTKVKCGRRNEVQCPGSSYCFPSSARRSATCCCNDSAATCPDCTRPVNCLADPCDVARCPAVPDAKCRADYCGGCNARFFVRKGRREREVTDRCNEIEPCSRRGGEEIGIGCGFGGGPCPGESYCDIHPLDAFATCCCNNPAAFCPNCTLPFNCLVNPCQFASCSAFPGAKCRADYCGGCNARFFVGKGRKKREVTDQCNEIKPCSVRGGKDIGINCGRGTTGECPGDSYCDIHPADRFATCCCNNSAAFCPNCTLPFNCLVNPCQFASCSAFPDAKCRADYCGGCNARFFVGKGRKKREVTDQCNEIKPCSLHGGKDISINCGRGTTGECPGDSYCDIHPADRFATCCCNNSAAFCPNCTLPFNCLVNPCQFASCSAFPDAKCRADYCGGCNARFFVGKGRKKREVTDRCNEIKPCSPRGGKDISINCGRGTTGKCPGDSYCDIHPADAFATCCCNNTAAFCPNCTLPFNCARDPCRVEFCLAVPDAKCSPDHCGGCNARFFVGKGKEKREVTDQC